MTLSDSHKSDLLLVVVTLLAALSWAFSKEAVLLMPPLLFMAMRFLIAGAILALFARHRLKRLSTGQVLRGARVGLVFGSAMSCWVMGIWLGVNLGEAAFITSLAVVITPAIARVFFREAQPVSTWMAIPVAICGLALLSLENGFRPEPGQLLFVLAAFVFAFSYILTSRTANTRTEVNRRGETVQKEKVPALPLTALSMTTAGVVTGILSLIFETWEATFASFTGMMFWWLIASATIGTAFRFLLQTYAQSLSFHSHGVVILVLEPVWVALLAWVWFAQTMSPLQIAGCGVILLSLLINRWTVVSKALRGYLRKSVRARRIARIRHARGA
ncbi:Threonine/homoserine efflux transporter RhtA [Marinobacter daqiaonensis]|uniref:Threonine/homoserine efflux transporter RhtA n=1 Tax=Marinobacter daqiaonensis TaxID=650891 RepID=A0A1I6H0F2_9GAMM|nr:DMT family transporter [Marinobacter daqiaonensis]SFR47925.1 Threonine/homoserine efflux transporter RhtA [Marinobacter daqiaonensis]